MEKLMIPLFLHNMAMKSLFVPPIGLIKGGLGGYMPEIRLFATIW